MTPQTEVLYEHLKKYGTVTQIEAFEKYGIFRAASRIHEMRKAGIAVDSTLKTGKNRYGVDVRYAEYRLGANA
jgi:hypothetical protein